MVPGYLLFHINAINYTDLPHFRVNILLSVLHTDKLKASDAIKLAQRQKNNLLPAIYAFTISGWKHFVKKCRLYSVFGN